MECRKEKKPACLGYKHGKEVPEEKKGQEGTKGSIVFDQQPEQEFQEWAMSMEFMYKRFCIRKQ